MGNDVGRRGKAINSGKAEILRRTTFMVKGRWAET